ncbi:MAG: PQ-loop repeat-containing protein [Alphaproteobacteria bacterium]|nr:PQ-loop repeat-containing protein [Alphaproteobacteria bacterium]
MKTTIAFLLLSIYTVLEFVAYMPQIIKILKRKSADDLSLLYWLTWIAADLCYFGYILLESPEIGLMFIVSLDLVFLIFVLLLTIYYQKHGKKRNKQKHR